MAAALTLSVGALLLTTSARAQTTLFNTGFEASQGYSTTISGPISIFQGSNPTPITTFNRTPGTLLGQPQKSTFRFYSTTFTPSAIQEAVNGVTVVNTAAAGGTQSALFNGTALGSQSVRYYSSQSYVTNPSSIFRFAADMRVTNPSENFGQWGINVLEAEPDLDYSVGAFGFLGGNVVATNDGINSYVALDLGTFSPIAASYGAFNNYALQLDFASKTFSGFFNGNQVGFVQIDDNFNPIGAPTLTLALSPRATTHIDYAEFGQALDRGTSESANFDNVRVSGSNVTVAAPEPGSLVLLSVGLAGIICRKRRRQK